MKTVKLNCASCGAPITIPDGVDTVVCSSCNSTLTVDRGEGYITLKVLEKLSDSIQEMGQMTSSAIKENAFVTQTELKRMQLLHLVSLEEMKINSTQAEIRAAKRRTPPNAGVTAELADLVLQDNDSRMHIRSINQEIAHLDPGWEESLNVIRDDRKLLDQAIACLNPYSPSAQVNSRLEELKQERRRVDAAFNSLETRLLRRELSSLTYPTFERLNLEEMEALTEKIPGDLAQLNAGEPTPVRKQFVNELTALQGKINAVYPRRKLESLVGPLPSLDYKAPFPESPEQLKPLIGQLRDDITRVEGTDESLEKEAVLKVLNSKLDELTKRADQNIPAAKARKKKTRLIVGLSAAGLVVVCSLVALIAGGSLIASISSDTQANGLAEEVQGLVNNDKNNTQREGGTIIAGQFNSYTAGFFEVTANRTYLRDQPSTDSAGTYEVKKGDILIMVNEGGLPASWFKVTTLDGSVSGYLAIDWGLTITVDAIPGDILQTGPNDAIYQLDFSSETDAWTADKFDDEYASGWTDYQNGSYVIDITASDQYIYHYSNQTVDDLPENYIFSLSLSEIDLSGSAYYGLQTNVADDMNFDAVLIAPDGSLKLVVLREGQFTILYDTADSANTTVALNPSSSNLLSMRRQVDLIRNVEVYEYALNGQIFARMTMGEISQLNSDMGCIIYLDAKGDHAEIGIDNFTISQ